MKNQRGFSLIELLIVIVIIAVIAAIAIPNLLSARRAANEGSAVSTLRTLYGADVGYAATVGAGSYAGAAATLGTSALQDLAGARLIDDVIGGGNKSGYGFLGYRTIATPAEHETFYFTANPRTVSGILMTGTRRFGVATEGVIRFDVTPANLGTPFDAVSLAAAAPISNP